MALWKPDSGESIDDTIARADSRMYSDKQSYHEQKNS
jgi:hypothetical protein